jgi:predicted dehydrogenase
MRAVLVGLGSYGYRWAEDCRQHPDVDLVAFVAHSERSKSRALKEWGVPEDKLFMDLDEALSRTGPDFLIDVTPPSVHREVALRAFDHGVSVLGEKPLSDNLQAAAETVRAGLEAGVHHMISQQQRFGVQHRLTQKLLMADEIGEPGQIDVSLFTAWADSPGTHYVTEPYMFLTDMGCHHFDAIRYVLGETPISAQVLSWNLSWGWHQGDASHTALFQFPRCQAVHRAMGCSLGRATPWNGNWRIEGEKGTILWQDDRVIVSRVHRTDATIQREIDLSGYAEPVGRPAVLREFLAALRDDREPECSGRDNLETMKMTFAAVESARTGRTVSLESLNDGAAGNKT